nr:hypothetical protein [Moritella viscosa]SHO03613.1 Cell wall binding repeat 2-containing protein [Moritella viscosa]
MRNANIKSLRETLLKEISKGEFSLSSSNLCWGDEIRFILSQTMYKYDYQVSDHYGQLRIFKEEDSKTKQKIFPKELTPIIINQIEHYLKRENGKYQKLTNKITTKQATEVNRIRLELNALNESMDKNSYYMNLAIKKIGSKNITTKKVKEYTLIIYKLTEGIRELVTQFDNTSLHLNDIVPERDFLNHLDRDFYMHYSKLEEILKVLK